MEFITLRNPVATIEGLSYGARPRNRHGFGILEGFMKRLPVLGVLGIAFALMAGCTGGAAGDPSDDIGDIFVLTHSPGNGDQLDLEDSTDGYNALNNPTLRNPGGVTVIFTNALDPTSVINPDPADPQGTRNVRLFYFDTMQGPFDRTKPVVPGVNPPGANRLLNAQTILTSTNQENDTLIIRPTGFTATNPMPEGQYSLIVERGVRGADGDGMKGQEYFFSYRVGEDNLGPTVVESVPAPGQENVPPDSEIRITMSETILASTVNNQTILVNYQPAGAAQPVNIPGTWYTDGGNGPGNNFPCIQLDQNGNPGFTGVSPRNGADLVFRPAVDQFPVNMTSEDPNDPFCSLITDPPRKGNTGFPLGQAITVSFVTQGVGVSDTAQNQIPAGSPNTSFTFQTTPLPAPVFAPSTDGAVYFADTVGVGAIDVDPARTPYSVGPNPARQPNTVVTSGQGPAQQIVRVPVPDLVDMTTDTRTYSAFYTFICSPSSPSMFNGVLYACSASRGGGEVVVIDTFNMVAMGRFGTPSPGGIGLTAFGSANTNTNAGRACVSNFSANTVTVFDISDVKWFTGPTLFATQSALANAVILGSSQLILSESDFTRVFPTQRVGAGVTSPPGPPVIGTLNVGVGPTKVKITGLPNSLGVYSPPFCYSPILTSNLIVCSANAGESTADFSELTNLNQSAAIEPDLDGVNLSSQPTDVTWAPLDIQQTGSYFFFIAGVGGTVELFATGFLSNAPSVKPNSSSSTAPNKIINNISGFSQPTALQWITSGTARGPNNGYTIAALVAETGENRLQQVGVTSLFPNLFQVTNSNHTAGLGPVDITGDPAAAQFSPCTPTFTTYYVANAGEGTVRTSNYQGGVIGTTIPVPGVLQIASWWSR
jgi:hypothetical protein